MRNDEILRFAQDDNSAHVILSKAKPTTMNDDQNALHDNSAHVILSKAKDLAPARGNTP